MSQEVTYGKRLIDLLSSVKLAFTLLSLIAISSVFGTLIKQGGTPEDYLESYSESTYRIILFFGLDDVFHTKWFMFLLFLFAMNLSVCSFKRLIKELNRTSTTKKKVPGVDKLQQMPTSTYLPGKSIDSVIDELQRDYRVVYKTGDEAYLERGRLSKYGVYFVHGSIIFILVGSLIGLLFGFRGFISLKKGEEVEYVMIRGKNPIRSRLNFVIRCKDFKVDFYPDGTPKDYVSEIEILKNGTRILEKKIRVNEPLKHNGLHFYQASYGKENTFYFEVDGKERAVTGSEMLREGNFVMRVIRYEHSVHSFGPGVLVAYLEDGNPFTTWFLRDVEKMNTKKIGGKTVRLKDVKENLYTVLEVTKDPGIYVVWSGFSLLLFGLFLTFFTSHKKIYLKRDAEGIWIAISSQRAKEEDQTEMEKMRRRLHAE